MVDMAETEKDLLEARIRDAVQKSEKGAVAVLPFLTPRDRLRAERALRTSGFADAAFFWGGYPEAERATLFLLPEYLLACLTSPIAEATSEELISLLGEDLTDAVSALCIRGSGFGHFSHRDVLGAVLATGLERDALGDIAMQSDREAILFCPRKLAEFLTENLHRVGNDTVRLSPYTLTADFTDGRHYRPIADTVASERLDCIVAALCNLSRDAAQTLIRQGAVEVNYEPTQRTDLSLEPPTVLSIRGYGRFILRTFEGSTKKGRLRMRADQLV